MFTSMILVLALGATVDDDASGPRRDSWGDPLPAQAVARLGTARFRGVGPGSAAALAPDGKRLVVAGQQGLFFWDLTTGHVTKTLPHQEIAHGLSFAPDGKILAVTAFNAPIRLLDPETGRILQQLTAAGKIVDAANVEFSLDGAFLSASQDRKPAALCHVWEVATGKHLGAFAGLHDSSGHTAPGPGGRLLLSWGECANPRDLRGFVQVLDVKSGTPLRSFKVGPYPPSGALSPDGRIFAACADTESVSLWDVASGIVARELSGLRGIWGKMRFSPDGKLLAAGAGPGTVVVWDLTTGKRLDAGAGPRCRLLDLVFPEPNKVLACGFDEHAICLWDAITGQEIAPGSGHRSEVVSVAFRDRNVCSVGRDGKVCIWDLTGKLLNVTDLRGPKDVGLAFTDYGSFSLSRDGKLLAGVGAQARLWDAATCRPIADLPGTASGSLAFSPNGEQLAALGHAAFISIWDLAPLREKRLAVPGGQGEALSAGPHRVAFAPNGHTVVVAVGYNQRRLPDLCGWRLDDGSLVWRIPEGDGATSSVTFAPDGKAIACAGAGFVLREAQTGELLRRLHTPASEPYALAFSPDGRTVAGTVQDWSKRDHGVFVWELASGLVRSRLTGYRSPPGCVAFSPDGTQLVAGSLDLLVWDVTGKRAAAASRQRRGGDSWWRDLADPSAETAFTAIGEMLLSPDAGVPLLRDRLQPAAEPVSPKQVQQLLAQLADESFAVRTRAARDLDKLGSAAMPFVEESLRSDAPLEVRRRLEALRKELRAQPLPGDALRVIRAVEVLEGIDSAEARSLLTHLATGAPRALQTIETRAALARLSAKSKK